MANGQQFRKVQRVYYIDGHVIEWRTFGTDADGNAVAIFDLVNEQNVIVGNVRA